MEMFLNTADIIMARSNWIDDLYFTIQTYSKSKSEFKMTHIQTVIDGLTAFQHIQLIIGEIGPVSFNIINKSELLHMLP